MGPLALASDSRGEGKPDPLPVTHDLEMETTPDWLLLTIAGLGLLGTLAGVLVTQRWSDRREAANLVREQERWRREDEARTFDHRRVAYSDFYESLQRMARRVYDYGMGLMDEGMTDEGELPFDWNLPTFDSLQHLQLYATPSVALAASDAYDVVWQWGHHTSPGTDDDDFYRRQNEYDVAEVGLLTLIRESLSIPDT
jgi:hypothetical protein